MARIHALTANGNLVIPGIAPGRLFSLAVSGDFDDGTLKAQYATGLPATASLEIDDAGESPAINLTSVVAGVGGNSHTFAIVKSGDPNESLSIAKTGSAFVVTPATDAGDHASIAIGAGENGVVTVTADAAGPAANAWELEIALNAGNNKPLAAGWTTAYSVPTIRLLLGTGAGGAADDAKNTATLVAAAIAALTGVGATASGTGETALATPADAAPFTGGGDNSAITSTSAELVALIAASPETFAHFTAALETGYDGSGLLTAMAETAFTGGTAGTFSDFTGSNAISFTAAGEIVGRNFGCLPCINLNLSDVTAAAALEVIIHELPRDAN